MILQVFDKIRNYQITYYYNMLILSQKCSGFTKSINFA